VRSHRRHDATRLRCRQICSDLSRLLPTVGNSVHTADVTQLDSCVALASAVCIGFYMYYLCEIQNYCYCNKKSYVKTTVIVAGQAFPLQRGLKRRAIVKYGSGGLLLFLLIFIIWFPLLLFSLSSTIFVPDPPVDVTVDIKFWGYQVQILHCCS